jgi:2-iminobutanoate/2-iminopropanoate deaminase
MSLTLTNPDTVAAPMGQYSHAVDVPAGHRLVFVSGQVGVRPDGVTPEGHEAQADQVYDNLVAVLADRGVEPSAIIKLTTFIVGDDPDGVIRAARRKYLGEHRPASTAVYVSRLVDPRWLVEIEAIALAPA